MPKKTSYSPPKSVAAILHDEARRKNIPTAEFQSVVQKADQSPLRVAYERRNRDLDPQLVWRGKDDKDWSELVVHAPPLYIQEKVHPKALIDVMRLLSKTKDVCRLWSASLEKEVVLETALIHPLLKGSEILRYAEPIFELMVLFPYKVVGCDVTPISLAEIKKDYPKTYEYLQENKKQLLKRSKCDESNWWLYPYPKHLALYDQPKVVIQVLSSRGTSFLDQNGQFYFLGGGTAGGYAVSVANNNLSELKFLTGLLNSPITTYFVSKVGSPFRGGFYAYGKSSLFSLPVPVNANGKPRNETIEFLVEVISWLYSQPSVRQADRNHPQDPLIASYFEQTVNALVYELFFPQELHDAGLKFFELAATTLIAKPMNSSASAVGLDWYREQFKKLSAPGHPLRVALEKLQTLDLVRTIEGQT